MKRAFSIILAATLFVGCLFLPSCGKRQQLTDRDAWNECAELLNETVLTESYAVDLDLELRFCLLFAKLPARLDELCTVTYSEPNSHYRFTDEGLWFIGNERLSDSLMCYDREVWYVDGSAYYSTVDGEKYYYDGHISGNDGAWLPNLICNELIYAMDNRENELVYYEDGECEYIELTVGDCSLSRRLSAKELLYRVYPDGEGRIEKITVFYELYGIRAAAFDIADTEAELTLNFTYDGVEEVTYPENADEFVPRFN